MSNPAGIFQVDHLLATKIKNSGLEEYVNVEVKIRDTKEEFKMVDELLKKV